MSSTSDSSSGADTPEQDTNYIVNRGQGEDYPESSRVKGPTCHDYLDPRARRRANQDAQLREYREKALRDAKYWEVGQRLVERMINKPLPNDITLLILEELALATQPRLHLKTIDHLHNAARLLLERDLDAAHPLAKLSAKAILAVSAISLDVAFQRNNDTKEMVAHLPKWIHELPSQVRNIDVHLHMALPSPAGSTYPTLLYRVQAAMPSLVSRFPALKTLRILLCYSAPEVGAPILDMVCRRGYSGETKLQHVISDVLDAARNASTKTVHISMEFVYASDCPQSCTRPLSDRDSEIHDFNIEQQGSRKDLSVEVGNRAALDVVKEAFSNHKQAFLAREAALVEEAAACRLATVLKQRS